MSGVSLLKAVVANATAPVRLQEMEPEESVPALRRSEVDIAIGHAYDLVPRDLPVGCERHDLLADPVAAVLPLTDPLHDPQQLSGVVELAQLGDRPWVLPLPGTACYELIQPACGAAGFVPRAVVHCSDFAAVLALVGAGAGVSLVPRLATGSSAQDAALHPMVRPVTRSVYALTRRGTDRHPAVRVVLDHLIAAAAQMEGQGRDTT
jgi:DNA-binding transcriptional LysR family regulator